MNLSSNAFTKTERRILDFFFENPEREVFEKEVRKLAVVSAGSANSCLKTLYKKTYLLHRKLGRMNFYKLNSEDSFVKQLKKAYTLSLPVISKIKEAFKNQNIEVYLYGSAARGEDTEKSDIDLLIIGNIEAVELEKNLTRIKIMSKKEIKPSLFRKLDWISVSKKDPAFFERVQKDKIRIV